MTFARRQLTQLTMMATVYYSDLPGILDMLSLISQQYHKADVTIIPSLQKGKLRLGTAT